MNERTPRDILADRIAQWAGEASVYDYADRLIKDLDAAGYDIVERHPYDEFAPMRHILDRWGDHPPTWLLDRLRRHPSRNRPKPHTD